MTDLTALFHQESSVIMQGAPKRTKTRLVYNGRRKTTYV